MHFKKQSSTRVGPDRHTDTQFVVHHQERQRLSLYHGVHASVPPPAALALLALVCRQGVAQLAAHHHGRRGGWPLEIYGCQEGKRTTIYIDTTEHRTLEMQGNQIRFPTAFGATQRLCICHILDKPRKACWLTCCSLTWYNPSETRLTSRSFLMEKHRQKSLQWKELYLVFQVCSEIFLLQNMLCRPH